MAADEKTSTNSIQEDVSRKQSSDQCTVNAAQENCKGLSQVNKFLKSQHLQAVMIFLIGIFAVLASSQWQVISANSDQTQNLTRDTKSQTEAVKGSAEAAKKTEKIAKSKAPLEIQMRREFNASLVLESRAHFGTSRRDDRAKITRKQGNTKEASKGKSSADDRTQITLQFHNLSHRPMPIIDVYVRQGENILGENRIKLPIRVKAKENNKVKFPVEEDNIKKMTDILIRDGEDNEYICAIGSQKCINKSKTTIRQGVKK